MKMYIFIILYLKILIIINQSCGAKDPKNIDDCIGSSSTNSICCFTKIKTRVDSENRTDTLCIFVPRSQIFITPHIKSIDIGSNEDDIDITLDCGFEPNKLEKGQPYSYCGENPKVPEDCIKNSMKNASCCYIKNSNGNSFCVLNNGIYNNNSSYFGINIICNSKYLKINLLIMIVLLMLFFLL